MYLACSNCGNLNKQGESSCYSCGHDLSSDIPPPPPPSEPEPVQDSTWEANTDIRVQPLNPSQGGDATKARTQLGWQPQHTVQDIVHDMMESDLRLFERDRLLLSNGIEILMNDE